jgi:hypothetical protein
VNRRDILERRRLEYRVVHHAAIWGRVGGRGADTSSAVAPDLLELGGRHISTVVGGNSGPKLVAARLVDGTEAVSVHNLGLMRNLGVDTQSVEWLRGSLGSKSARLGQEDLVLNTCGRGADGCRPDVGATIVAHWGGVAGRLRVRVVFHCHGVSRGLAGRAARSGRGDGRSTLAAVAAVRELVEVQTASKFGLLEVCSNMLVGHLLHTGLKEVVLLIVC